MRILDMIGAGRRIAGLASLGAAADDELSPISRLTVHT